jgi:hypothetical protein
MTVTSLDFIVPGKPEPQGSVRAFVPQKDGKPMRRADGSIIVNLTSDNPAFEDDSQVVDLVARKRYASGEPWTRIVVRRCEVQTALDAAPPQMALA